MTMSTAEMDMITEAGAVTLRQNLGESQFLVECEQSSVVIDKVGKPVVALVAASFAARAREAGRFVGA